MMWQVDKLLPWKNTLQIGEKRGSWKNAQKSEIENVAGSVWAC
jgi:hypothetical protein